MPTAQEYRYQAEECLELAHEAKELYVQSALVELAREFIDKARELERNDDEGHAAPSAVRRAGGGRGA
jgi:hypothetical protein